MMNREGVFKKTYENYLTQIEKIDLNSIKQKLNLVVEKNKIIIPLFGKLYTFF